MTDPRVDERYYQATPPRSLGERLIVAARDRIYDDFIHLCSPTPETTILDVGVSDVINDGANLLERRYPHPERISAAGLGEGADFRAAFPAVRYTQIQPNQALPYPDDAFDIAVSNAVIEHTGSPENQVAFVTEMMRVARTVFLTAPNRFFPVEHHTAIPLLHYWRPTFALACKALGKEEWLDPKALILIDKARLAEIAPAGSTGYTGLSLGPFSSNLFLLARR
jgi:hypothetical protein